MTHVLEKAAEKGSIVRFWFGTKLAVGLADPRDIEVRTNSLLVKRFC